MGEGAVVADFNPYNLRTDGKGREYAVITINSRRFGFLQVLMDKADLDTYIEEVGARIYARKDDRGIRAVFAQKIGGLKRETELQSWVLRKEIAETGHRVHVKDGNLLDVRRSNLELRSRSEIGHRTLTRRKRSALPPGVSFTNGKYMARLWIDGKFHFLGTYDDPGQAHAAYLQAKRERGLV